LGKEEIILKKYNGFSFVEVFLASSIIFFLATTLIPIYTQLQVEREVLKDRRTITKYLHDDLQNNIQQKQTYPKEYVQTINDVAVNVYLFEEGNNIVVCGEWNNEKAIDERKCLYGTPIE